MSDERDGMITLTLSYAEYEAWVDGFGERCERCRLPVAWHQPPRGAYRCILTVPVPPERALQ